MSIQFKSGEKFSWRGKVYSIQGPIGSGMTADVYAARVNDDQLVAIKVLKNGVSEEIRSIFIKESENLGRVKSAWNEAYPNDSLIIPEFYGAEMNAETPFIVMELIKGEKLSKRSEQSLGLNEETAFWIGLQIGKLLTLLHEKIGKCYSDIKLDNFWLVENLENEEKPLIKVTDWSILAELSDEGVTRDLFFASLIMNHTLTGYMPEYALGQLLTSIEDAKKYVELCSETKEFLSRALSRNLNRRYQTSRDWLNQVTKLHQLWSASGTSLLNEAIDACDKMKQSLDNQKYEEAAIFYDQARVKLEISGEKGVYSDVWEDYWQRIKRHEDEQSHLGRGKTSLLGSALEKAIGYFSEGADLYPSQAENLWRWEWLAKGAYAVGVDAFRLVRNEAIKGLEELLSGNSNVAFNTLYKVIEKLNSQKIIIPDGFRYLTNEAQILNLCNEASALRNSGGYDDAIEMIKKAANLYVALPNDPPIHWVDSYGDINKLLDNVIKEKQTIGESNILVTRAKQSYANGDIDGAAKEFHTAYSKAPQSRTVIIEWKNAVKQSLKSGEYLSAYKLIKKAYGSHAMDDLEDLFSLCQALIDLAQRSNELQDGNFVSAYNNYLNKTDGHELAKSLSLQKIMREAFIKALSDKQYLIAEKIGNDLCIIWPDLSTDVQDQMKTAVGSGTRLLWETSVASLQSATVSRLEAKESRLAAYKIVSTLAQILDNSTIQFKDPTQKQMLDNIKQNVIRTKLSLEKSLASYTAIQKANQTALEQRIQEIKQEVSRLRDISDSTYPFSMERRIARGMALLAEWEMISDDTDEDLRFAREGMINDIVRYGSKGWKDIISEAEFLLDGGYMNQAAFLLDDLDNIYHKKLSEMDQKYQAVRKKLDNVIQFHEIFLQSTNDKIKMGGN